jgi:hypothetical protein
VIFLGFGFHPQNMKLLDVHDAPTREAVRIFATAFGEPLAARPEIEFRLKKTIGKKAQCYLGDRDDDCAALLRNYQMHLSS